MSQMYDGSGSSGSGGSARSPRRRFAPVSSGLPTANLFAKLFADVGVTVDGGSGKVTSWADQSGAGKFASVDSVANGPTVNNAWLNGKKGLVGNGVDSRLTSAVFGVAVPQPATYYIVLQSSSTGYQFVLTSDDIANEHAIVNNWNAPNFHGPRIYAGIVVEPGADTAITSPCILRCIFNGGSSFIFKDNVQIATGNCSVQTLPSLVLFNAYAAAGAGFALDGTIGAVAAYSVAHSAGDSAAVEAYLRSYYGL